ncbi:MAG: hypothetical protein IPL27_19400 [Lewinellaceae bacterium]|nr:hypothetical protein [Lewinellaceae bacterium]
MVVTVANTGPFDVTAPNGGESWQANSAQSVTWTVNGTDSHCANVDILISTDNGVTYTLVGTFPNNGTAGIMFQTHLPQQQGCWFNVVLVAISARLLPF